MWVYISSEYPAPPWKSMEMTENEWIAQRVEVIRQQMTEETQ